MEQIIIFFIGFTIGIGVIGLYSLVKSDKAVKNHPFGSLEIVKNGDSNLEGMFVDFDNPPDEFYQGQEIELTVNITDISQKKQGV